MHVQNEVCEVTDSCFMLGHAGRVSAFTWGRGGCNRQEDTWSDKAHIQTDSRGLAPTNGLQMSAPCSELLCTSTAKNRSCTNSGGDVFRARTKATTHVPKIWTLFHLNALMMLRFLTAHVEEGEETSTDTGGTTVCVCSLSPATVVTAFITSFLPRIPGISFCPLNIYFLCQVWGRAEPPLAAPQISAQSKSKSKCWTFPVSYARHWAAWAPLGQATVLELPKLAMILTLGLSLEPKQ